MNKQIDLSLIVVTYNSADNIGQLLSSIKKSTDKLAKEVVIVDNASSDDTVKVISQHPYKAKLIKSTQNKGFAKAVNQAIKSSRGKYVMLINPDTALVGKCLDTLYTFAEKTTPLGAVAPRLLNFDNKPQASIYHFPTITNAFLKYFLGFNNRYGKYLPSKTQKVEVAIMAAFLIPRTTLEKVGLLDERFFLYYEDIEFCKRLWKKRLPIYYLHSAKVKHISGASGHFKSHLESPLLKSAQIYHGRVYSKLLNLVLLIGQKYQRLWGKK